MYNLEYRFKRVLMVVTSAGLAMGATACSTTQTVKVAQSAPITYKVGQGATKYASTAMPSRVASASPYISTRPSAPRTTAPQVFVPEVSRTAPQAMAPIFDQSRVDRTLYKHQKVGKTYTIMGKSYTPKHQPDYNVVGIASWYGDKFHGKPTATGEIYDKNDITAAHKTLPLNSMVHVTNLENNKTLMVRVNDRGPFIGDRIIDLSEAAATILGTKGKGLGKVRVQYAGPADPMAAKRSVPAPQPRQDPIPQIAEAPSSRPAPAQEYRPLRQQPMAQAPMPYTAPQIAERPTYASPEYVEATPSPIQPQAPQPYATEPEPEDGGQVTLTIKGPIHVAGYGDRHTKPRLIKERLKTK